jgi:hypothetical protein
MKTWTFYATWNTQKISLTDFFVILGLAMVLCYKYQKQYKRIYNLANRRMHPSITSGLKCPAKQHNL